MPDYSSPLRPKRLLSALLAVVILLSASMELMSRPAALHELARASLGQWCRVIAGILEVEGVIGLLIAALVHWAAELLPR